MATTERPESRSVTDRVYDAVFHSYFWRSIFRSGYPNTPRNQMLAVATNVFLHLHPTRIHRTHVRITHTFCLGGLSFFLFLGLTITGVLLMFYYVPSIDRAYTDMQALETDVRFGMLMRNMHRWMAHGMVLTVLMHMMRVFYTGAYKPPREFNWVVGVVLLVLTLLLSFTGYLLPWDQLAIWAITVGTNMARATPFLGHEGPGAALLTMGGLNLVHAGDDVRFGLLASRFVGEASLLRFYVLHCVAIPLGAAMLMAIHFWRIRKDGGISGAL